MYNSKISIVIVNWNRKGDLRECLKSIKKQSYKPLETIVVDNHSTDGSIELVRKEFPDVTLIVMPNSSYGACETFNIGFATAKGKYVAILDNDVILPENWIKDILTEFEKEPKTTAMISTRAVEPNAPEFKGEKEYYSSGFTGCGSVIKKSILDKTKYYPKEFFVYNNEADLAAQILNLGHKIKQCPRIITYHKKPYGERMGKRSFYYHTRNRYWYMWKYYTMKSLIIYGATFTIEMFIKALRQKQITAFLKGVFDAFLGVSYCLKNREVCDQIMLEKVTIKRIFKFVKNYYINRVDRQ